VARAETQYVCQSCGGVHAKWAGRCEACGEWNTLAEESAPAPVPKGLRAGAARPLELVGLQGTEGGGTGGLGAIDG
jgi:DNA repair protein RadA/Sms